MQIEQKQEERPDGQRQSGIGSAVRILYWFAKAVLVAVVLFWLFRIVAIAVSFFNITGQVGDVRGLPGAVANTLGLMLSFLVVTLGGTALYFLVTGFRLGQALLALAALAVLQFLIHAGVEHFAQPRQITIENLASRPLFDRKGNSLVWYVQAKGESCPEIFDAPGFHPITREQLMPLNSEIARTIQSCLADQKRAKQQSEGLAARREKGLTPAMISDPIGSIVFFDPTTGDPSVWVARNGECYDLFRNGEGGYHPVTRIPLVAVNPKLVNAIRACKLGEEERRLIAAENERAEELAAAEAAKQEAAQLAAAEAAKQEVARLAAAEAARQEPARAREARLASARALAPQALPATFKLVNHDCVSQNYFLNDSFQGTVPPNGGTIELQVTPGTHIGRVCLSHDPNRCAPSRNEVLTSGSRVTRWIKRNPGCPGTFNQALFR